MQDLPAGDAIAAVLDRLVAEHARYFPRGGGEPVVRSVTGLPRRLSDLARVSLEFPASTLDIFVKVHKKPTSPIERVRAKAGLEFEMLCRLFGAFRAIPGHAVPRPVAFFPDQIAVVTEAVTGENLHHLLKREARGWPSSDEQTRLAEYCRAAGVWLRHFQRMTTEPRHAPFPVDAMRDQVQADLATCERMGLSRRVAREILDYQGRQLEQIQGLMTQVVGEHPDFQPDNVLWAPDTLTVIDFTSFRPGTRFSDPARFLACLAFLAKNPLYRRGTLGPLGEAFLDAYEWPRDRRDPALNAYLVRYVVQAVRTASTWPHPRPLRWLIGRRAVGFLSAWWRRVVRTGDALVGTLGA